MRALKLVDIVIQGTAFLIGLMILFVFGGAGYMYWITMGLLIWILVSSIIHVVAVKKLGAGRMVLLILYGVLALLGGIAMFGFGYSFARINFYLTPLSYLFVILHMVLCIVEYQNYRTPKEEMVDF